MDYKFIKTVFIIFFIFYHNTSISEIVYDKDKILITKNEILIFQNLYKNYKGIDIKKNNAIKNIILQKKVIEKLKSFSLFSPKKISKSLKFCSKSYNLNYNDF